MFVLKLTLLRPDEAAVGLLAGLLGWAGLDGLALA